MKDAGIMEDDLVAIKKTTEVRNGDIVVARIDDEVTLKYFQSSGNQIKLIPANDCLLYTSPSPRDRTTSRMPSSA